MFKKILLYLALAFVAIPSSAERIISGVLKDIATSEPIAEVTIRNVYSKTIIKTDSSGKFNIQVKKGELLEFKHISYETIRIRIESETGPDFYNLIMRPNINMIREVVVREKGNNYKIDSIKRQEYYDFVLRKPKEDEINTATLILDKLSKRRKQEFAFVKKFNQFEQERYVDYMFNAKVLEKWTGLKDDSLRSFMIKYRPTYQYLRSINDYRYLEYLKKSLNKFCPACIFKPKYKSS
jgi:hypothetical protein